MRKYTEVLGFKVSKGLKYPIGAFDIETVPPPGRPFEEALFGLYADGYLKYEDDEVFYRCRTITELWQRITFRKNVTLFAHNFRGYESNYIIDSIPFDQKLSIILQGDTQVIGFILEFEDGVIEIRDSLALVPMSLKEAAKAFATKAKGDIGLGKGEIYNPDNPIHQEYCKTDVAVTIEVVQKVVAMQRNIYGCGIGWTSASTAMHAWRSTIPKGKKYYRMSKANEIFCRLGYYGGFVYPGKDVHRHDDVVSIDRNAAYAAVMRDRFPVGKPRFTVDYEEGVLGMYEVKVHNGGVFPCLPYRGTHGLVWPQGKFSTIVTSEEIAYARSLGIRVEVIEGLIWDQFEYPFLDFINECEECEFVTPDLKPLIKLIRNGLYGKFGSKLTTFEACVTDKNLDGWNPFMDPRSGHINFNLWVRETETKQPFIQPHWAAFVTARQRLWLFETIHKVGIDYVFYCDTDSVKADGRRVRECIESGIIDTKGRYGSCKIDEEYVWFQCLGSKVYHGELTECCYAEMLKKDPDASKFKMRAKGVPAKYLSTALFDDAYREEYKSIKFGPSSNSTFVRMKRGVPMTRDVSRKITNRLNSKAWCYNEDGTITPVILK